MEIMNELDQFVTQCKLEIAILQKEANNYENNLAMSGCHTCYDSDRHNQIKGLEMALAIYSNLHDAK